MAGIYSDCSTREINKCLPLDTTENAYAATVHVWNHMTYA